jgi:hypothetical protein
MPRPKNGYTNAAGQEVPATNQIVSRYGDKSALIIWANQQGLKGIDTRFDKSAINIGSAVHKMAELDLIGAPDREIETTLGTYLSAPNHLALANNCFRAFRAWREQCRVRIVAQETSLVSEPHQYGGTPDLIALVNNTIGILDFKTSTKGAVYPEMKITMAAHANLWNEANPKMTIDTYHLIALPKDGGDFKHHAFDNLAREWEIFKLYRELWRFEKEWEVKPTKKTDAKPKVVEKPATGSFDKVGNFVLGADKPIKPRIRVKMQTVPTPTLAEMLRAYGHVPEERT